MGQVQIFIKWSLVVEPPGWELLKEKPTTPYEGFSQNKEAWFKFHKLIHINWNLNENVNPVKCFDIICALWICPPCTAKPWFKCCHGLQKSGSIEIYEGVSYRPSKHFPGVFISVVSLKSKWIWIVNMAPTVLKMDEVCLRMDASCYWQDPTTSVPLFQSKLQTSHMISDLQQVIY